MFSRNPILAHGIVGLALAVLLGGSIQAERLAQMKQHVLDWWQRTGGKPIVGFEGFE